MILWGNYRDALQADFARACDACVGPLPDTWVVVYGFRTEAEQAALYAKYQAGGPLAAQPGHSAHEVGLAIDVALQSADGANTWNYAGDPAWRTLWAAVKAADILHSGVEFPPIDANGIGTDPDHIERLDYWQFVPPPPESQA